MSKTSQPKDILASTDKAETDTQATPPDPFDPASLRLGQDYASTAGVQKVITVVPVRKPNKQEFFRVREGEDWRLETLVLEDQTNRDTYLVDPSLRSDLMDETTFVCLFTAISRQGAVFLWPAKMPAPDGRTNNWHDSALQAADIAQRQWVKMAASMAQGMYLTFSPISELPEPEWPEISFRDLLAKAFGSRRIASMDHPVLKELRGEL